MYLAYYDQDEKQDYMQPVWVFQGDCTLDEPNENIKYFAYVPAVKEPWLVKNAAIVDETEVIE